MPQPRHRLQFRYTGLKLILQSGGQIFFLPVQWHKADGTAVVLPRTDALRLEFTPVADPDAPAERTERAGSARCGPGSLGFGFDRGGQSSSTAKSSSTSWSTTQSSSSASVASATAVTECAAAPPTPAEVYQAW